MYNLVPICVQFTYIMNKQQEKFKPTATFLLGAGPLQPQFVGLQNQELA